MYHPPDYIDNTAEERTLMIVSKALVYHAYGWMR